MVPVKKGESVRWENIVDGRWVAIARGTGDDAGKTIVTSSEGERQVVGDYDSALAVAKQLRTQ